MEGLFILFAYTVVILFLTIDDRANGTRQFNTGGGRLNPLSGSLSIAAAWIWAPALFVSSERGYLYGWQGLAWFIVPNVLCLLLFAPFAEMVRRIFPAGVTLSGFMESRYKSRAVGNAYRFQLGALAAFSTGVLDETEKEQAKSASRQEEYEQGNYSENPTSSDGSDNVTDTEETAGEDSTTDEGELVCPKCGHVIR